MSSSYIGLSSPTPVARAVRPLASLLACSALCFVLSGCDSEPDSHVVSAPPPPAPTSSQTTTTTVSTPTTVTQQPSSTVVVGNTAYTTTTNVGAAGHDHDNHDAAGAAGAAAGGRPRPAFTAACLGSRVTGHGATSATSGWRDTGSFPRAKARHGSRRAGCRKATPTDSTKATGIDLSRIFTARLHSNAAGRFSLPRGGAAASEMRRGSGAGGGRAVPLAAARIPFRPTPWLSDCARRRRVPSWE